ncbi:MAG TPA: hypothetical protein VKX17_07365 [Planctomycetota bacterium]|nr:hypothetical protein [Planctomycetota bacterium]
MTGTPDFDPFAFGESKARATRTWLIATGAQALITSALLIAQRFAVGKPYEDHVRMIICLGIVATWSLALRTIRARLLELITFWQKASMGLLKRASESGCHLIPASINRESELYIKGSIRRLRIIAAGLTIPFFVMPMICTFISVFVFFQKSGLSAENWFSCACFMLFAAVIVAGYFHWAIVPLPVPVRVHPSTRSIWRRRRK